MAQADRNLRGLGFEAGARNQRVLPYRGEDFVARLIFTPIAHRKAEPTADIVELRLQQDLAGLQFIVEPGDEYTGRPELKPAQEGIAIARLLEQSPFIIADIRTV